MGTGVLFALFFERLFPTLMSFMQHLGLVSAKFSGWQSNAFYTTADRSGGINITILIYSIYALEIAILLYLKRKNQITRYFVLVNFFMI